MIPTFPEFKKIATTDRIDVEAHTSRFEPYSDFNFTSLWVWNTGDKRRLSELNKNLVVEFTDYVTGEPFLSFIGNEKAEETTRTLIEYSRSKKFPPVLKLIPEAVAAKIKSAEIRAEEDRGNYDYLYSIAELATLYGKKYESFRKAVNRFKRENPDARMEVLDWKNKDIRNSIMDVFKLWERRKTRKDKDFELEHEKAALGRLLDTYRFEDLSLFGLYAKGEMVAFSIDEIISNGFTLGHFWKADIGKIGIYEHFISEKAKHFAIQKLEFMNYEQDLGLKNLRASKESYRPVRFLKKYSLSVIS
jgi:hypothetical protein